MRRDGYHREVLLDRVEVAEHVTAHVKLDLARNQQ